MAAQQEVVELVRDERNKAVVNLHGELLRNMLARETSRQLAIHPSIILPPSSRGNLAVVDS